MSADHMPKDGEPISILKEDQKETPGKAQQRQSVVIGSSVIFYDDDDNDDNSENQKDSPVKVRWNMRRTANKPCLCCCQLCGVWIGLIFLLIVLAATVASIEFSLSVPFYDRGEINQQRFDSYSATEVDADFISTYGQISGSECVHDDPTILTRNGTLIRGPAPSAGCQRSTSHFLRLIYISEDRTSNMLTEANLQEIQKIEDRILSTLELSRYCYLIDSRYPPFVTRNTDDIVATVTSTANDEPQYVACERIDSVLNFLDPRYFDRQDDTGLGYYLLPNDQVPQEYNFSSLDDVVTYWSDFGIRSYNFSDYDFLVATVGNTVTIQNLFWPVTSSEFSLGSTEAVGLTSTYALGLPVDTYSSPSEEADDQYDDIGEWLWDEFDSFLKDASFEGVDVYWSDSEQGMENAEAGLLAVQSMAFFPISLILVLLYLIYMQDSMFIGLMGIMQIMLAFVPTLLVYRYVVGEDYLGILNLIAVYIILGIGVDDIFVFADQFYHQREEKQFDLRMQKTYNLAGKAIFTTSCTTFISFISNAGSAFPAVATFGLFAALLVAMNYLAVVTFFPAVMAVYHTRIRQVWWDHPSLLFCCNRTVPGMQEEVEAGVESEGDEGDETNDGEHKTGGHSGDESSLVAFFRDRWAPLIIRLRYPIVIFYGAVFIAAMYGAAQLEPDEEAPSTLPDGNNYKEYPQVLLEYFARAGNPRAIEVRWVSGINPDDPIDRSGTDDTNITDYGQPNFLDCSTFNPSTPEAQVWSLQSCHDMFFGNVTDYHNGDSSFGPDGINGPKSRLVVSEVVPMTEFSYYSQVSCPMQGMRDWTITDTGCAALQSLGLPCMEETSQREGCTQWDVNGNSCEPFPVPADLWGQAFRAFLEDETRDPVTQQTNYDTYSQQIFAVDNVEPDEDTIVSGDFSCRAEDGTVLLAISSIATLDQDFAQNFEVGIALYEKWDTWSIQMRASAPREMVGTMQTSNGSWAFYFLNDTLISETFSGIALALGLSFLVLTFVSGNIIMSFFVVLTICLIVVDVFAFTVLRGWSLGVVEAINYVVVIGMSIDYAVHMSEAYTTSVADTRAERVILMMEEMGVSVLSGALSTLLAVFLMFFAPNSFFVKFATFLFVTIALSCLYAMTFFPALLSIVGPLGTSGEIYVKLKECRKKMLHQYTKDYIQSKEFFKRETENSEKTSA